MSDDNPQVIIIAGPNGAGKTTLAPFLLRDGLGVMEYVNADPIASGLSGFDTRGVAFEAGRIMVRRIHELAQQRKTFAFETTLSGKSYAPWIRELQNSGYRFQLLFLWLRSADLAVERVHERVRDGGHDVAEHVVRRRHAAGLRNFWKLYKPLADSWAVYDNSTFAEPRLVAKGSGVDPDPFIHTDLWSVFRESET